MATNVVIAKRLRFRNPQSQTKSKNNIIRFSKHLLAPHKSMCLILINLHGAQLTRDFTLSHRWFIIEHHIRQPNESILNWSIMASYDFHLQVNTSNIFLKKMCQKSKMDTTIDFVKYPQILENKHSLENYSKR